MFSAASGRDGSFGILPPPPQQQQTVPPCGVQRIAIDCGRVISVTDTDTRGDVARQIISPANAPSDECIGAVGAIVERFGRENVFVLSKCGTHMQQASVSMMSQSIRGGANFFERTGLLPANVLFCTERSGGRPPAEAAMQQLDAPHGSGSGGRNFVPGARVAPGRVGKGALAMAFGLTTLIDDKDECLESFRDEGPIRNHTGELGPSLLLQAHWAGGVRPSRPRRHAQRELGCRALAVRNRAWLWHIAAAAAAAAAAGGPEPGDAAELDRRRPVRGGARV